MARHLIVLIDDDQAWTDTVGSLLRDEGFEVRTAVDGRQGIELIEQSFPSLVVLDLNMPRGGGLDVLRELRRRQRRIPVLVVSADPEPSALVNARATGAASVLSKPVSAEMLRLTIHQLINLETLARPGTPRPKRRFVA